MRGIGDQDLDTQSWESQTACHWWSVTYVPISLDFLGSKQQLLFESVNQASYLMHLCFDLLSCWVPGRLCRFVVKLCRLLGVPLLTNFFHISRSSVQQIGPNRAFNLLARKAGFSGNRKEMKSLIRLESFTVGIVISLLWNPKSFETVSNRVGPDLMLRFPGESFCW